MLILSIIILHATLFFIWSGFSKQIRQNKFDWGEESNKIKTVIEAAFEP